MIPSNFDYVAPTTVDEAVAALAQAGEDAKVIAGGQSLMPVLRLRLAAPTTLVDLGRIDELRGVREDGDALVIGAMTTYYDLLRNPLVGTACATARGGHPHRRRPADPAPRDAGRRAWRTRIPRVTCAHPCSRSGGDADGRRPVGPTQHPGAEFFVDYFTTALQPDEILAEVRIPKHTDWAAHYEKLNRVAQAWSIVAVAATVEIDGGVITAGPGRADQHGGGAGARPRRRGGADRSGREPRS